MSNPQPQVQEYVFIPVIKDINSIINNNNLIINGLTIPINRSGHITSIDNKGIHNVLVLTGYAVDEKSGILVPTLDPCDYVKGILVAGQPSNPQPNQPNNFSILKLKLQSNKLYILRKSNLPQNGIVVNIIYKNEHTNTELRTRFVAIGDSSIDDILNTLKQLNLIGQNQQIDEGKLKKDIKELFNYYAVESS
ncbi:type III-B CRISPR system CMR subunit Cmr7 [Sulfurisphaera ohwakuensis]|uniref:type III-B CRISPR system CMR subunit Cmr7 n=1 Tax=Sulfurisphaera ohwakuensis TaxID=69656 RepID=UPI0036F40577